MTERKKAKIAWSDDLSYDSEEEREKERIALAELAEIETPEKPSYSDEELDKLVTYIQRLTTLFCLRKEDWNIYCINTIKEFFMEPKCLLLTIFFHNNKLVAMLCIPTIPVYDLTYFSREPDMIFTLDNFHDEIVFGTFVESVEESLLKMLEYVYAPVFFTATDWPEGVKSEFCIHLHTFLAKSTDLHYKMLGLTVIYIPREGLNLSVEEASANRELVKRLESVVVHWTHQLKSCIEDHDTAESKKELVCPPDEYEFWVYRYENLNSVNYQIKNKWVDHISKILINTHSSYIKQFQKLCEQVTECMVEAKSNIEYLQIIQTPCIAMESAKDLNELPQYISKILNTFRYIWLQSPYYNTPSRLINLYNSLSNQVILQCSKSINLKALFSGKTRAAMEEFRKCIECCKTYREIYDSVADAHNELTPGSWNLDTSTIFNYINSFVQRCFDMLEVCNCMIIFGRIDEVEDIPIPRFGGTKGEKFEKICGKVERSFRQALSKVEGTQDNILDVQATSWYENILEFNATIKHIEVLIENLVSSIFGTLNNVEEGVQVLCSMYNYSKRINLRRIFEQKTMEVWNMFQKEIADIKQELVAEQGHFPASIPAQSGQAIMAFMRNNRLVYLKKMMHSAAWMLPCSNAEDTMNQQKKIIHAIETMIKNTWKRWAHTENADIILKLNKSLLRGNTHQELIECNIDRSVLETICESRHWQFINWEIPPHFTKLYSSTTNIRYTYENMLILIQGYNRILTSLSNDERKLFKPLINDCLKTIKPGLKKLQWASPNLDTYIVNSKKNIKELQNFLDCYKLCNQHIVMLLEKICDTPLLEFKILNVFDLEDLQKELKRIWDSKIINLWEMYKEIITYLIIIYEGFEKYLEEVPVYWVNYLSKYDKLLENAFLLNVKTSMQNMHWNVSGDGTVAPQPLLNMKVVLTNSEICYIPTHEEVMATFTSILSSLVDLIRGIPRLLRKFGLLADLKNFGDIIENDSECQRLNGLIIEAARWILETETALEMVLIDTKMWDSFKHIWEVQKDEFLDNYMLQNPTARDFDKDIMRYGDLGNDVQMQENISQVDFIILNYVSLKVSADEHCMEWQTKFERKLKGTAQKNINAVYKYIKTSSKAAMRHPSHLVEFQELIESYDKLCSEILQTEKKIAAIKDQVDVLVKYEVESIEELKDDLKSLSTLWSDYLVTLDGMKKSLDADVDTFKTDYIEQSEKLSKNAVNLMEEFVKNIPKAADMTSATAFAVLNEMKKQVRLMKEQEQQIREGLSVFKINLPTNQDLAKIEKEIEILEEVWQMVEKWEIAWESYRTCSFWTLETDEIDETIQTLFRTSNRLSRQLKDRTWDIIDFTRGKIDAFRRTIPLLGALRNDCMRERHWNKIKSLMISDFDQNSESFKLETIMELNFQAYTEEISEISTAATMEMNIENGLKLIEEVWSTTKFEMEKHTRNVYRIKSVDECTQFLDDHQVQLSVMKSTRYVEPFINDVEHWEKVLSGISDILEMALQVQRRWLYLENIFLGDDIRKQLPAETEKFDLLTAEWENITSNLNEGKNAAAACYYKPFPHVIKQLSEMINKLESIQRTLEKYLETKRQIFPRFYFISNDDLLEILGNSTKPYLIQTHMKKLFDNFNKIKIEKVSSNVTHAKGMISADGEMLEWKQAVVLDGPTESWLCKLEDSMRSVLKQTLIQTRSALRKAGVQREKWIDEWPGQLVITSSKIQWTRDCVQILNQCKLFGDKKPLKRLRKKENNILKLLLMMSRKEIPKILRLKVNALAVIEIHSRDVVDRLYKSNCKDVSSFEWFSQLKFYWEQDSAKCVIRQTNTMFYYTYEYIGNSGRLVITPLTDRCYITLTTALNLFRGGSPQGPAGTGKTETVKDLGRALARWVVVTNCSEGLDYKSMAKCFAGIAQSGCWGCFDEFNRINIEVLSVVAQQISSILISLSQRLKIFVFNGSEVKLVNSCGIFITMNPGYAGRTELPDNLKSMFRPISMCVPDNLIIAENTLFSDGFEDYKSNAKKVFTLYELAKRQLSKQDHYDFGLRSMVALLRYAGVKRRNYPGLPEQEIVILAMRDMNFAKLTAKDVPLFNGIIKDIFPESEIPSLDYDMINSAITAQMKLAGLQPIPIALQKVIQLMETKNSRHSTMILGDTNTAKSISWQMLAKTLTSLKEKSVPGYETVYYYPINPKALTLSELYGEYNLSTAEWTDGVISSIMRKVCQEETPEQKWLVFDGPVDAIWIENLNSVMDDNKLLTLINSERISMPPMVSLLFEALDLSVASPATVSRCGIVYNDYKDWRWRPFVDSWLETVKEPDYRQDLSVLFDKYLEMSLEFRRLHLKQGSGMESQELTAVRSLCRLMTVFASTSPVMNGLSSDNDMCDYQNKMWFMFCLIWSVGATLEAESQKKFNVWLREVEGIFPIKGTVYDYYVDVKRRQFIPWEENLSDAWRYSTESGFHSILVPTLESLRIQNISSSLIKAGFGVLVGGPSGTGKTSLIQGMLNSFDCNRYSNLIINMSAHTTSRNVQDMIETRLEKRTKGIYFPFGGKKMIFFMDDMNIPARDKYGSQPPLELIRQWLDYTFWYDREKQTKKNIKEMIVIGAVGPPGGARSPLPPRLLSEFHCFYLPSPSHSQLVKIFGTMLSQHFVDFDEETKGISKITLQATIDMFDKVVAKLLPTPEKMHYLFNLRDISRIFQGMLRSNKDFQNTKTALLRLWIHETFRVFHDRLIDEFDRNWFVDLVNDTLEKYFDRTFHNLCPEKQPPVFGDFINAFKVYEDIPDREVLRNFMERELEEYNSSGGVVKMDLVLFKDAIEHIARIVRVISQQRGNMLLIGIGGSGRQSLTKLASHICEYNTFQIVIGKNYGLKELREDLKSLYMSTGVLAKPTTFIFSDTQIVDESFTEVINNLLNSGEVINLFKVEEFEEIRNALEKPMKQANILQTNESTYLYLVNRVRENLHIVVCMSPIGDIFRNRMRQYPALINCTTIDWFMEWPREALLEVALKFLTGFSLIKSISEEKTRSVSEDLTIENKLRNSLASVMSIIQSSVSQYSRKMLYESKRTNYVTPTNYLELVFGYKKMLTDKRNDMATSANKLRNGLSKLEDTRLSVESMSVELEAAKAQVAVYTQQCLDYMGTINIQQRNADEQQRSVAIRSNKTAEEEIQCQILANIASKDLAATMPALEEAENALKALNKKDITEIKSYAKPPVKIEMVLEAVMTLLQVDISWAEAKRQLGDQYFLENLRNYDKNHIPDKVLKRIAIYTANSEFEPEKVGVVSSAAKSLCLWVRAIEKYGKVYKIVKPKKERLDEALASLRLKQKILAEAQDKLRALSEKLKNLQKEYDEKLEQKEELTKKAIILQAKLDRAAALVDGLGGEKVRWKATVERLDAKFINLPGDCLVATAFISYLGPFGSHYREKLTDLWMEEVEKQDIPHSLELNVLTFLLDDAVLREWNHMGLPGDLYSAENAVIVTNAKRWPLAVDPQGQALIWISKMEEKNGIKIIDFGDADYLKTLQKCLTEGIPVLIQNTEENIDPSINSILNRAFVNMKNRVMITFNQQVIDYNINFRLYLATKLGNPTYRPEILTKTTMVNFAVKEQGLQAQLLGIVVRKEVPRLEQMKDTLVVNIARNKKILIDLENELLRLMNESEGSLLENEELFTTLQTSHKTSVDVKEALETSQITEKEIDIARQGYVPTAERASVLFFVLIDLAQIDPMYQFSLEAYIDLFFLSIKKSDKSDILEERINNLNEYHSYAVYKNTCRALFERHKLVFTFHMVAKIMNQKGKLEMNEYQFLLKGGVVLDRTKQLENPTSWLPDNCWDNITELNKIGGFHGVIESFEAHSRDWQSWYLNPEPESLPLIGEWNVICNDFQRLLFLRCLRMDRLTSCLTTFIINTMGARYVNPPVLDVKEAWEESHKKIPLLFVLSPGVDPTSSLIQLAADCKMTDKFHSLSLGQGQSEIAARMLEMAMNEGGWVFLANCHLACGWLNTLRSPDCKSAHPQFRLWLSSMPDPAFPLTILQKSIKMTTEPPQGIKGNMALLFSNVNEEKFNDESIKYRKLLYCISFFHCALVARKRFRQLGFNVVYSFNNADFEASENLLSIFLDQFEEIPWQTLKYLFAVINYGGHVTDEWDMRVLNAYINQIFCPDALSVSSYRLSPIASYLVPRDGSLENYKTFIDMLPSVEKAESVGQHASADVACLTQDATFMCDALLSLVQTGGEVDTSGRDEKVSLLAKEMLFKFPKLIDIETTEVLMGLHVVMPICVSLLQELVYFNDLIIYITARLKELMRAIEGLVIMSEELDDMCVCLFEGKVPNSWVKARPSIKPLGSWCRELSARGSHLDSWARTPRTPPALCWLPCFNSPTGFLTAVMQTTARQEGWPIDTLCWEFTVMDLDDSEIVRPPADGGVYIRGLFLEGADWSRRDMHMSEPQAMTLVCPMSPIRFKPIQIGGKKTKGKYTCPTYYYPLRKGSFVVGVDLSAGKQDSNFWIKRGTALLCTLST